MKKTRSRGRPVAAGRFKAECLALLDRVAEGREVYIVTKRGRPVAQVIPIARDPAPLIGSVTVKGDIVGPVLGAWNVDA
jgi:antitoxin (DNA-binding transcriptional repressor) of toxin-antitoxin stability system